MNDAELVERTWAGEIDAFAELARRWSPRITALCHSRVRRADVADDLAQETLLRGFRSLHTLNDSAKFGSWLMGIALRAALDWLKASERKTVPFSVLGPDDPHRPSSDDSPDNLIADADERQRLLHEVEALPEVYRQAIMMYYYDDFTYRDLAKLLNVSPATINARLTKARSLLRERLGAMQAEYEV